MIKKLTRWLFPSFVAILLALLIVTPVLAIEPPSSLSIDGVWVYRNCREAGDQLYLVSYNISYGTNPTEDASEAYLVRLMDGATELKATRPYAYYNDGYGEGVASIYFDAVDAPTWIGNYTMLLVGNPFLSWNGTVPEAELNGFNIWQDNDIAITRVVLSGRIATLATDLETAWGQDMVNLSDTGQQVLTNYGLAYFINVVPYLSGIAPYVFADDQGRGSGVVRPEIPDEVVDTTYADSLVSDIIGTPFDLTAMATSFGTSRGAMTAILYYGILAVIVIILARKLGTIKPMMLLSIPLVILGAFIGVPLIVTILAGLAALAYISWTLFYKSSTA